MLTPCACVLLQQLLLSSSGPACTYTVRTRIRVRTACMQDKQCAAGYLACQCHAVLALEAPLRPTETQHSFA